MRNYDPLFDNLDDPELIKAAIKSLKERVKALEKEGYDGKAEITRGSIDQLQERLQYLKEGKK